MEGPISQPSDLELLQKAAAGNARAFHSLVERHSRRMYRLAVSLLGNAVDAEDVLQEAFSGAYRAMRSFEARASVKTWLTRILVTQVAKWRRDHRRDASQSLDAGHAVMSVVGPAERVDRAIDLHAALGQLSAEHREVLVLREFEQMSYEEMAQVLGVPRGTVESRLHRARQELRKKLEAYLP